MWYIGSQVSLRYTHDASLLRTTLSELQLDVLVFGDLYMGNAHNEAIF